MFRISAMLAPTQCQAAKQRSLMWNHRQPNVGKWRPFVSCGMQACLCAERIAVLQQIVSLWMSDMAAHGARYTICGRRSKWHWWRRNRLGRNTCIYRPDSWHLRGKQPPNSFCRAGAARAVFFYARVYINRKSDIRTCSSGECMSNFRTSRQFDKKLQKIHL